MVKVECDGWIKHACKFDRLHYLLLTFEQNCQTLEALFFASASFFYDICHL